MKDLKSLSQTLKVNLTNFCLESLENQEGKAWLEGKFENEMNMAQFFLAFAMVNKKVPRIPTSLSKALLADFEAINPAFKAEAWNLDELVRLALLLHLKESENKTFIEKLLGSSDRREQILIYKSIPYLGNAQDFVLTVADGIRTNMVDVFDAIVLHNSFAYHYFEEPAWNQMVLKAIFMERPIFQIFGLDQRKNKALANILFDFTHERWSAGRLVTPELWRMLSGFCTNAIIDDLKEELSKGSEIAKIAAAKALIESEVQVKNEWFEKNHDKVKKTSWAEIGQTVLALQTAK